PPRGPAGARPAGASAAAAARRRRRRWSASCRGGAAPAGAGCRRPGSPGRGGWPPRGPPAARGARRGRPPGCGRAAASRAGSPRRGGTGSAGSTGRRRGRNRGGASGGLLRAGSLRVGVGGGRSGGPTPRRSWWSWAPPAVGAQVERDLHGAPGAGVGRVVDRVLEAGERVGRRHEPAEVEVADQLDGGGEVVGAVVVLVVGVDAAQGDLALPHRGEVDGRH